MKQKRYDLVYKNGDLIDTIHTSSVAKAREFFASNYVGEYNMVYIGIGKGTTIKPIVLR